MTIMLHSHHLVKYFNCSHHPLELKLKRPEGMVGVVIANEAPLWTIAARLGVRVQLHIAIGHVSRHCIYK